MQMSNEVDQLAAALAKAQAEIDPPEPDKTNPAFKSRYASLAAIIAAVRPVLARHGLSVSQMFEPNPDGRLDLTTVLLHQSGQWLAGTASFPVQRSDPQGYASASTYARRYSLLAVLNICADDDDDGNAASQPQRRQERPQQRPPESRGDQGAQRARAAVQAQEQPAASLVTKPPEPTPTEPPGGWGAPAVVSGDGQTLLDGPHCSGAGCGMALTKGQHDVSVRTYGQPLCPRCQKKQAAPATGNAYAPENR